MVCQMAQQSSDPGQEDILYFHQFAGEGDAMNDLQMNRNNRMLTVSVTGMELTRNKGIMLYKDLKTDKQYKQELAFISELASL